jgi:hypothetical protein
MLQQGWLGARSVGRSVSRMVGWSAGWLVGWSNGLGSLEATLNAHVQPAMPTPLGDAGARVTVPPGNAVIGEGLVGWSGSQSDNRLVGWLAG